jgi:small GTP-binding protein
MTDDLITIHYLGISVGRKLERLDPNDDRYQINGFTTDTNNNVLRLVLYGNNIANFPKELFELRSLEDLILVNNKITQLPNEIESLINLKNLFLGNNRLRTFPMEIVNFKKFERLGLSINRIKELPVDIDRLCNLENLKELYLSDNYITRLPPEIMELDLEIKWEWDPSREGIYLEDNPLEFPPIEIVKEGHRAVIEYFASLKEERKAFNEVKVMIVGDGGAGKTSLIKQLFGEKFNNNEPQTHGINIRDSSVFEGGKSIVVHFWDFGGQEIMHTTHQFFLSKRSLYILVLDGRKEEDAEYWLKHIESFGGNSPILVVLNKIDQNPGFEVNRRFLQDKYREIKGFYRVSCASGFGIQEFSEGLGKALLNVKILETTWPTSWFNVKTRLETLQNHFISYDEYIKICEEENINERISQETLIDFLHDLGVVLHFKDFRLLDIYLLDPRWVTNAVYKIINSEQLAEQNGLLKLDLLDGILNKEKDPDYEYSPDTYRYIIELMKKFELCFEIDNNSVLIPDLLEVQEPIIDFEAAESLKFIIEYDFLPKSVLPRFIVKMHEDIKNDWRWRTGVVLEDRSFQSAAVIKADEQNKRIFINVKGDQKRDYFAVIRKTLSDINNSFENLSFTELVPLPGNEEFEVEYEELIGYEIAGRDEYFVGKIRESYSVTELLNGIEKQEIRKTLRVINVEGDYYEKPEMEIVKMKQEKVIRIGDNSTISAPIVIADTIEHSFNTLTESTVDDDLKQLLDQLLKEINEVSKVVPKDKTNEVEAMARDAESLVKEATSSKPRQRWYDVSIDGLKQAAINIGEIAEPVLEIVKKLVPLLLN